MNVYPVETIPLALPIVHRLITLNVTRDGVETPNLKFARLMRPADLFVVQYLVLKDGAHVSEKFVAAAIDGTYLLLIADEALPRRAAARYPSIDADLTMNVDVNDGSGGAVGVPATVSALVRVGSLPTPRNVVVLERQFDGEWRVAGQQVTAAGTIELRVVGGDVYAMSHDDYGVEFVPFQEVSAGQRIRPVEFLGWVYEVTEPGTLPADEPEWWPAEGENASRPLGTARAIAVRYYRPLAHGPIPVEIT